MREQTDGFSWLLSIFKGGLSTCNGIDVDFSSGISRNPFVRSVCHLARPLEDCAQFGNYPISVYLSGVRIVLNPMPVNNFLGSRRQSKKLKAGRHFVGYKEEGLSGMFFKAGVDEMDGQAIYSQTPQKPRKLAKRVSRRQVTGADFSMFFVIVGSAPILHPDAARRAAEAALSSRADEARQECRTLALSWRAAFSKPGARIAAVQFRELCGRAAEIRMHRSDLTRWSQVSRSVGRRAFTSAGQLSAVIARRIWSLKKSGTVPPRSAQLASRPAMR